jgi:hypothetical protein
LKSVIENMPVLEYLHPEKELPEAARVLENLPG